MGNAISLVVFFFHFFVIIDIDKWREIIKISEEKRIWSIALPIENDDKFIFERVDDITYDCYTEAAVACGAYNKVKTSKPKCR